MIRKTLTLAALAVALAFGTADAANFDTLFYPLKTKAAKLGTCNASANGKTRVVVDSTADGVCDVAEGGGGFTVTCQCKNLDGSGGYGWEAQVGLGGIPAVPAASTTVAGVTMYSTNGETTALEAVQGSDHRIAPKTRTVTVDAEKTAVAGAIYNTVTAALAYVATQSPSEAAPWVVDVYGQSFTEEGAMTLPIGTHLKCHNAGGIYFGGSATTIQATMTSGTFLTMQGGSITNCIIQQNGTPTGARTVVSMVGAATLDHVGVVANGGNNSQTVIGIDATPPSGFIVYVLYYVVVSFAGDNANAIGIRLGVGGFLAYDNGILSGGGGAGSNGKALQVLTNSPGYAHVKNVSFGSTYAQASDWTLDISEEGSGAVYIGNSRYNATAGTITDWSRPSIPYLSAPPFTCDAAAVAGGSTRQYVDTDGPDLCTCMGAGGWTTADGSGTCA